MEAKVRFTASQKIFSSRTAPKLFEFQSVSSFQEDVGLSNLPATFNSEAKLTLQFMNVILVQPPKILMLIQPVPRLDGGDLALEIDT